jgi:hypothetical protein
LGVTVVGGGIGYFLYKKFIQKSRAPGDQSMKVVDQSSKVGASNSAIEEGCSPDNMIGDEIYEEQYHPTPRAGGIDIFNMNEDPMKKFNAADDVISEEQIGADEEDSELPSPDRERFGGGAVEVVVEEHGIDHIETVREEFNMVTDAMRSSRIHD